VGLRDPSTFEFPGHRLAIGWQKKHIGSALTLTQSAAK
jgi:hypothetical protein